MSNFALLVGINIYQTPGNDLQGCLNDVGNMGNLLVQHCGYSVLQVKQLINQNATKANIMRCLRQMIGQAQKGDHLVFHFSGHGSQVPDIHGDESDGMDEILCPYDHDWNGTYITDDVLRSVVQGLDAGATLDVILDSCHSGTGLREIGDPIAKFIPYPFPVTSTRGLWTYNKILEDHDFPNIALFSGCRSDQTSADAFINNQHQGAMTWAFTNSFYKNGASVLTRARLQSRTKNLLAAKGYDQEPQLECSDEMRQRRVFE